MMAHAGRRRAAQKRVAVKSTKIAHNHEHDYSGLLDGVRASFAAITAKYPRLFMTNVEGLNALYLDSLPSEKQTHTCHACQRFIGIYGKLVAIAEDGEQIPVMWDAGCVPEFYKKAFAAMSAKLRRARVVSVFHTKQPVWGLPITGEWSHIAVTPSNEFVFRERARTAGQEMAVSKENYRTVATALTDFTAPMLDEALRLLQADTLARSEKFIGPVKWLRALHDRPKGKAGENILWRAIADAPEGYCHPKASVLAPLLEDIKAGLPFADIKARFDAKMHPLLYQRPQAAPKAGAIKAAEELVEKLGIAPALERRFARLDEVPAIWMPRATKDAPKGNGVFGHLKAKGAGPIAPVDLPTLTMTWEKFARTVLPNAERMDLRVPYSGNFEAYLTAANADAPLIFKWDNPMSTYVYHRGSSASQWGLSANSWVPVLALVSQPNMWGDQAKPHLGDGYMLALEGAGDTRKDQGNALFPETLKDELHGARSVIEAYARSAQITRTEGQLASGYGITKKAAECVLRVFSAGAWVSYHVDRWD